jgi:hypothetical protein
MKTEDDAKASAKLDGPASGQTIEGEVKDRTKG